MAIDPNAIYAQAQLDPSYIAAHTGLSAQLKNLLLGYGDASALSPQEASAYGIQPGDISAANQNPYSTLSQLKQQLAGDMTGIQNTANSHGALFSGANAAATAHEQQAAGQRSYNALQALQGAIGGIDTQNTNALTSAYGTLTQNALNDPTIPAPAAAPAAAPAYLPGGGVPGSTPAPAASPGPREFIPKPPKPPALPKIGIPHA